MQFYKLHDLAVLWGRQCSGGGRSDGSAQRSQLCGAQPGGWAVGSPGCHWRLLLQSHRSCLGSSPVHPWSLSSVTTMCLSACLQQHLARHLQVSPQVPLPSRLPKSLTPCVSPGACLQHVSPYTFFPGLPKCLTPMCLLSLTAAPLS